MSAIVITPPTPLSTIDNARLRVFLAGSIEMGRAVDWQQRLIAQLDQLPITILNPRRADWDSSWVQRADNPQFREQVEWELSGLARADFILMYLAEGTTSPISLLELGLYADRYNGCMLVCCPDGFARKGNVEIVCEHCGVQLFHDWDTWVAEAIKTLN